MPGGYGWWLTTAAPGGRSREMHKMRFGGIFLLCLFTAVLLGPLQAFGAAGITVYKDPSCGCCSAWADHLKAAGFAVTVHEVADVSAHKRRLGVPQRLASCHTAVVDGYTVEGHVPAADIKRLLLERPKATGLAVPGMPHGSPGMETGKREPYDVLLFDKAGKTTVYRSYGK
jgi:hypothetical protein